ncbi:hypothetical protein JW948_00160 [bacterium]|nr:hypothetical protein [bacterium]
MKSSFFKLLLSGTSVLLFFRCEVKDPAGDLYSAPEIIRIQTPRTVSLSDPDPEMIFVTVSDPQGIEDIADVSWFISQDQQAAMTDNGDQGDLIPGDGQFTGRFSASMFADTGAYVLRVTVRDRDGHQADGTSDTVRVVDMPPNDPPELLSADVPAEIQAQDLSAFALTVEARDAQGFGDIDCLELRIYPPLGSRPVFTDTVTNSETAAGETTGRMTFTLDLSDTLKSLGQHQIRFQAWDSAGSRSLPLVALFTVAGVNNAPVLSELSAPDLVNRQNMTPFRMSVRAIDAQGPGDIRRVYFNSIKPDGEPASGNPFLLRDDGGPVSGDAEAGDGVFSIVIQITPENALGTYVFTFFAEDFAGEISEPVEHLLTVTDEELD